MEDFIVAIATLIIFFGMGLSVTMAILLVKREQSNKIKNNTNPAQNFGISNTNNDLKQNIQNTTNDTQITQSQQTENLYIFFWSALWFAMYLLMELVVSALLISIFDTEYGFTFTEAVKGMFSMFPVGWSGNLLPWLMTVFALYFLPPLWIDKKQAKKSTFIAMIYISIFEVIGTFAYYGEFEEFSSSAFGIIVGQIVCTALWLVKSKKERNAATATTKHSVTVNPTQDFNKSLAQTSAADRTEITKNEMHESIRNERGDIHNKSHLKKIVCYILIACIFISILVSGFVCRNNLIFAEEHYYNTYISFLEATPAAIKKGYYGYGCGESSCKYCNGSQYKKYIEDFAYRQTTITYVNVSFVSAAVFGVGSLAMVIYLELSSKRKKEHQ